MASSSSSESTNLEERLRSLLFQLQTESGILDRIVYKGKNQHRRCPYFQPLLRVRRDLRLLHAAGLGEILTALFPIIDGKRAAQKAHNHKRTKKNGLGAKHSYHERLMGVARILSQMAEPILKAAIQISLLLAKSFFTGFSVTILALLARLRVLVQQILLDVVSVYNKVSSLSQHKHSVKLNQQGIEAFREYHPLSQDAIILECAWREDKFVLLERRRDSDTKNQDEDQSTLPLETSIKYETIQLLTEVQCLENEHSLEKIPAESPAREKSHVDMQCPITSSAGQSATAGGGINIMDGQNFATMEHTFEGNPIASGHPILSSMSLPQTKPGRKVAFIPVGMPKLPETDMKEPTKKIKLDLLATDTLKTKDPFLDLLDGN